MIYFLAGLILAALIFRRPTQADRTLRAKDAQWLNEFQANLRKQSGL